MSDATADMSLQESCMDALRHLSVEIHLVTAKTNMLEQENAKLRELAHLVAEYMSEDQCEGCVVKHACNAGELDMCWIRKAILEKLHKLGIEAAH